MVSKIFLSKNKNVVRMLDLVIKGCILILSTVLPIFFVNNITLQGIVFQKFYFFYVIMFVIIFTFIIKSLFVGAVELRKHRLDSFVLLFVFIAIVGTFFSIDKYHSILGSLDMPSQGLLSMTLLIALYFIVNTYISKTFVKNIFLTIIFSGLMVLLWSMLILSGSLPVEIFKTIPANLIGSFSSLSAYLLINIPLYIIAFSYSTTASSRVKKIIGTIGFGLVAVAIPIFLYSFLYNYTKWNILLIGLVFFIFLMLVKVIKVSKKTFLLTVVIFIITLIFLLVGEPKNEKIKLPIEVSLSYAQSAELAKNSISDNLLFGTGIGTFKQNFLLHKSDEMIFSYDPELKLSSSSGSIFNTLTTQGLVGSVTFALLVIVGLYFGIKSVFQRNIENNIVSVGFGISSLIFILHSLFIRLDSDVVLIGVFIVIVYFAYITNIANENENFYKLSFLGFEKKSIPFIFVVLCTIVATVYVSVLTTKLFLADMNMRSFVEDSKNKNLYGMQYNADKVIRRAVNEGYYATIIAKHFLIIANFLATQPENKRDLISIKKSIEYAAKFSDYSVNKLPNNSVAWEIRGLVYENSGGMYEDALQKARDSYENALKYDSKNVNYLIALTRLKLTEGDFVSNEDSEVNQKKTQLIKDAKILINKAIEIKGNYGPSYNHLSAIEEALGNIDNSIAAAEKALVSSNNNVNYMLQLATLYQYRGNEKDLIVATKLLQQVLKSNKNLNIQLSLALLYERIGELKFASVEYLSIMNNLENKDSKEAKTIEKFLENVKKGKSNIIKSDKVTIAKHKIDDEIEVKEKKELTKEEVDEIIETENEEGKEEINSEKKHKENNDKNDAEKDNKNIRIKLLDGGGGDESISRYENIIASDEDLSVDTGEANSKKYDNITIYYAEDFEGYVDSLINKISEVNSDITVEQNNKVAKQRNVDVVVVIGTEK